MGWIVVFISWQVVIGRPKRWIPGKNAWCSLMTGIGYAFGLASYMTAAEGLHASVLAPLSSLYILVPPIVGLFQGKCITLNIAFGFICAMACLLLLSGWIQSGPSDRITGWQWLLLSFMIVGWGYGMVMAEPAGKGLDPREFPMSQFFYDAGFILIIPVACIYAKHTGDRLDDWSMWFPVSWNHILTLLSSALDGMGTGFFTLSMSVSGTTLSLMVGMTSLYIAIPAILGIIFLKDPVKWNVLLGLACACVGITCFSLELKGESKSDDSGEALPLLKKSRNLDGIQLSTDIRSVKPEGGTSGAYNMEEIN